MRTRVICNGIVTKTGIEKQCNRFLAEISLNQIHILCPSCGNLHPVNLKGAFTLAELQELFI